jgi:hypothetical protein
MHKKKQTFWPIFKILWLFEQFFSGMLFIKNSKQSNRESSKNSIIELIHKLIINNLSRKGTINSKPTSITRRKKKENQKKGITRRKFL